MRKMIFALAVAAAVGTGGKLAHADFSTITRPFADEEMKAIDLSKLSEDFQATIKAPEDAKAKEDFGNISIKKGDHFQIQIAKEKADIAARKKEIQGNTVNKLKKFHTEEDDVLLYEADVFGNAEFHFLANVKVGEKTFAVEDEKGPRFTKEDVEAMLKSAKTLEAKK